ncbi:Tumor necrosis factor receptor superfamily member 13B [Dissostichus eleginoides]|uniref:Tumor necrosis factor receptor superfamily member 13B n=1 Tax=Dissostichus eleginoides TaxID=100907 RepID=A0AAD9B4B1_DISEL|nr:Tumor necrosis factor receptor superfamily member 13B [Dissostichus eleginoides]
MIFQDKDSSWTSDRQLCCSDLLGILLFQCEGSSLYIFLHRESHLLGMAAEIDQSTTHGHQDQARFWEEIPEAQRLSWHLLQDVNQQRIQATVSRVLQQSPAADGVQLSSGAAVGALPLNAEGLYSHGDGVHSFLGSRSVRPLLTRLLYLDHG